MTLRLICLLHRLPPCNNRKKCGRQSVFNKQRSPICNVLRKSGGNIEANQTNIKLTVSLTKTFKTTKANIKVNQNKIKTYLMIKKHWFDSINHQPSLSPNLWSVCWRRRVGLKQFFILCTQRIFVWCSKSNIWCHYTIICNKMPLIQWEQMVTKSCWQQVHIIKVKTKENERFH